MPTVLSVMGVPITTTATASFIGHVCIKACIHSNDSRIPFTFYSPVFAGTFIHRYTPVHRRGYWR